MNSMRKQLTLTIDTLKAFKNVLDSVFDENTSAFSIKQIKEQLDKIPLVKRIETKKYNQEKEKYTFVLYIESLHSVWLKALKTHPEIFILLCESQPLITKKLINGNHFENLFMTLSQNVNKKNQSIDTHEYKKIIDAILYLHPTMDLDSSIVSTPRISEKHKSTSRYKGNLSYFISKNQIDYAEVLISYGITFKRKVDKTADFPPDNQFSLITTNDTLKYALKYQADYLENLIESHDTPTHYNAKDPDSFGNFCPILDKNFIKTENWAEHIQTIKNHLGDSYNWEQWEINTLTSKSFKTLILSALDDPNPERKNGMVSFFEDFIDRNQSNMDATALVDGKKLKYRDIIRDIGVKKISDMLDIEESLKTTHVVPQPKPRF